MIRLRIGAKTATGKNTKKTLKNTTHAGNRTTDIPDSIPDVVICERLDPIHMRDRESTSYQAHLILHCKTVLTNCAANTIAWKVAKLIAQRPTARGATGSILVENAPRADIATPAASSSSSSISSSSSRSYKANAINTPFSALAYTRAPNATRNARQFSLGLFAMRPPYSTSPPLHLHLLWSLSISAALSPDTL